MGNNLVLGLIRRLAVSAILVTPFLLFGVYGLMTQTQGVEFFQNLPAFQDFQGFEEGEVAKVPLWASFVILVIGGCLGVIGLYMSLAGVAPSPPLVPGEEELVMRHPTMKPAYARMVMSLPFFLGAGYMVLFTLLPYVYPFVLFVIGMYLFFKGTLRYLRNLHITYTVTDRRVIHMYRFLWLSTKEIPVSRIISIAEARNFFEILTGRGSVVVASGIGERQVIRIEEISDPGPVAEALRGLLP
ncbi:MAG: PH domain-containing protein [Chloroflexi bacterium]|nr:PH domain-containing protein [Chloroflexota bacterium]